MREPGADRLVPLPTTGRKFTTTCRVRFGDVSPGGRARFDALARYLQDVSSDDTADAGLGDAIPWVVRRTLFEVRQPARYREALTLTTFCSGIGSRWAERRVVVRGDHGAQLDAAVLWVHIDRVSGRPLPLGESFVERYGEAAAGREVSSRLQHGTKVPASGERRRWALRSSDFDLLGHVNNAVSWSMVEEVLSARPRLGPPCRAELEYRLPIEQEASVELVVVDADGGLDLWAVDRSGGGVYATGRLRSLEATG